MMTGEQFADNLRNGANGLNENIGRSLLSIGNKVWGSALENFTSKTGDSGYLIGPRSITNNLRGSITASLIMTQSGPEMIVTAGKVKHIKYAAALEFGAPQKNIQPRMYIGRAMEKHLNEIPEILKDSISLTINGQKVTGSIFKGGE